MDCWKGFLLINQLLIRPSCYQPTVDRTRSVDDVSSNKVWKMTNTERVGLDPRSSHTQRQTTFPDECVLLFPPCHVVSHLKNDWLLFVFLEIFFWPIPAERVTKVKGSGLPRMSRVGNLWVRSLSPRVENVWVRTPQVGNLVWYGAVAARSRRQEETIRNTLLM
jgi:hypothetical protein